MDNTQRVRRAEKAVSQRTAAQGTGIAYDRFWRIENGFTDPEPKEIKAIARYFRCSASILFPSLASDDSAKAGAEA
jgi:transcriptional regulator with XRE-family HTH domain